VTRDETSVLASAQLDDAWPIVELFSTIRREHPAEVNRAAEAIVARLRAHGVPVTVHEPQLYLALPNTAYVEASGKRMHARPAPLAKAVPAGVEAPLVFVPNPVGPPMGWGPGSAAFFGEGYDPAPGVPDVRGKIVLFHGMILAERILDFHMLGAAGVIAINPGKAAHWGSGSPIWGTADLDDLPWKPVIPAAAVGKPDGEALIALAAAGGSARLVTDVEEGWVRNLLPVVEIRGREEPEKFVLLHGHYDSWDVGVGDNATGDACMLEVARMLWTHRDKLKRSVRIAWWPGHSTGRFAGSTWYSDTFARDLARNCVAHMNCDSPGCRDATDYHYIPWMAENVGFVKDVVRDVADKDADGKRPTQSSDFSFNHLGITGCFSASSRIPKAEIERRGWYYVMGNGGNLEWHTDDDRLPVADRDVLLRDIKVYALAALRLATAPVLPFDWRALLGEFEQTLARYAKAAGDRFDLAPAREAVKALDQALARVDAEVAAGRVSPAAASQLSVDMSRLLVPLNYTRGTRWRRDLGLAAAPLTPLAVAAELDRYPPNALPFAQTHLKRALNHVLAALEEAHDTVMTALASPRMPVARAPAAE
jgi:N-acetylated-alpha-linked acidic dipeptidase